MQVFALLLCTVDYFCHTSELLTYSAEVSLTLSEGYGSRFVCVCYHFRCHSIYFKSKVRYHRLHYDVFLDFYSHISPKWLCSGDMALFVCRHDPGRFFKTEDTPRVPEICCVWSARSSTLVLHLCWGC